MKLMPREQTFSLGSTADEDHDFMSSPTRQSTTVGITTHKNSSSDRLQEGIVFSKVVSDNKDLAEKAKYA
jgi:hypothetical protein